MWAGLIDAGVIPGNERSSEVYLSSRQNGNRSIDEEDLAAFYIIQSYICNLLDNNNINEAKLVIMNITKLWEHLHKHCTSERGKVLLLLLLLLLPSLSLSSLSLLLSS